MKLRIGILLVLVSALATAQDGASLTVVPVTGMPRGSFVISYDFLVTEAVTRLVVHARDPLGVEAFYTFDHVAGELRGRIAAASAVPAQFRDPEASVPSHRTIAGIPESDRFRVVDTRLSPIGHDQYVTAVPLPERRFADLAGAAHAEMPPPEAALSIEFIVTDVNGNATSRCVIEPNLARISERMTTVSADWVLARGRPHLLVGLAVDRAGDPWPVFYRLYSPSMELVSQTPEILMADPNQAPQPVLADLTGDGSEEIIIFSNSGSGPAVAAMQTGPGNSSGNRVLALNDCAGRMNGEDVVQLQRQLEGLGYSVGRHGVDGWYGPDTRAAVVAYQRDHDLTVTGVVDEMSWTSLGGR